METKTERGRERGDRDRERSMNMGQVADSGMLTRPGGGEGSSEGEKTVGFFSFILFFESSLYSHFHDSLTPPPPIS